LTDKTEDGWQVAVSANITCEFLEFCRNKDVSFFVRVGVISGGGVPETDYFYFNSIAERNYIESLIEKFSARKSR
jgi:hypothetical protein